MRPRARSTSSRAVPGANRRRGPLRVGLTGGIGSGKSEALREFERLGAGVVCADRVVHELSRRGGPLHRAIVRRLGRGYLDARGELDRRRLGEAVFKSPALRLRLERITHPLVWRAMDREMRHCRTPVIVADVPLLFETRAEKRFDATIVVAASAPVAIRRLTARDGLTRGQALARMRAQLPVAEKARRADVVIRNDAGLGALRRSVNGYFRALDLIARTQGTH